MSRNPFVDQYGGLSNEILLNVAEMLTLRLPEGVERIIASKWVKKFHACDPKDYKDNLSLFVKCLTKQFLVKPFDVAPHDMSNEWTNFDKVYTSSDINKAVIHRLYKDSFTPSYEIDISQDMKEYVALQEIPFFGSHFYYAFSPRESIEKWRKFNKLNVPKRLIEKLRTDDEVESPIMGRAFRKVIPTKKSLIGFKTPKAKSAKPQWEGGIEEEPSQVEVQRSMISIPVDSVNKNLPPALQRRIAQAEKEKQERLEKKDMRTPKGRKIEPRAVLLKKQFRKSLKPGMDDIDRDLAAAPSPLPRAKQRPVTPPPPPQEVIPEFKGPNAEIQRRLYHLRKSNPPQELIQTTRDMNKVSENINIEAERLTREGTANLRNVQHLNKSEVEIGSKILKLMQSEQADNVVDVADNAADAVENIYMTMKQLDDILDQSIRPRDETIKRLAEIKEQMAMSAINADIIAETLTERQTGEEVVEMLEEMANINENSVQKLQTIQPETQEEAILIEGLENNNRAMTDRLREQAENIKTAIGKRQHNLSSILLTTAQTIDEILDMSFEVNQQLEINAPMSDKATESIYVENERSEMLKEINNRAVELKDQVERSFYAAASNILVARHLRYAESDEDDDIIDLNKVDMDFGETVDESVMEAERKKRQKRRTLVEVDDFENLFNISDNIMNDIELSLELIENELLPELQEKQASAENENEQEAIREAVENVEENAEILHNQLRELKNVIESESNATFTSDS